MDYSATHTLYIAAASPAPADLALRVEEQFDGQPTADADIYWKSRKSDAKPTSRNVFDDMPLGKMGFVRDPGRSLGDLEANP